MKSLNNIKYSFLITGIALIILASGCTKVNPSPAYIGLHLHTYIDTNVVDPVVSDIYYPDHNGRMEMLNVAEFYLTNLQLRVQSTQQWYTVQGSIILKWEHNEPYYIANIPAGTYDDVRFTVGLNNTLNSAAPSSYPTTGSSSSADTVLGQTEAALMWGSGSTTLGYTFMNVQGYDSTDHKAFSYQFGGMGDTVQVTLPVEKFIMANNEAGVPQLIHIICDYGKLLQNTNMVTSPTGSFYGPTQQQNVVNGIWTPANVQGMFRYECSTPTTEC